MPPDVPTKATPPDDTFAPAASTSVSRNSSRSSTWMAPVPAKERLPSLSVAGEKTGVAERGETTPVGDARLQHDYRFPGDTGGVKTISQRLDPVHTFDNEPEASETIILEQVLQVVAGRTAPLRLLS